MPEGWEVEKLGKWEDLFLRPLAFILSPMPYAFKLSGFPASAPCAFNLSPLTFDL
jgi:hypothetical protein